MFRSLLVPLDGSASAEQALPLALSIAQKASATVQLIHVHSYSSLAFGDSMPYVAVDLDVRIKEQMQVYLEALVQRLVAMSSVPVTAKLVVEPEAAQALERHAASTETDLIVMTTHGRGPWSRFWLGSVADALVREATMPILFVHPQETALDLAARPVFRQILIPLDGSPLAEQALAPAIAVGSLMQAEYTLLRIYGPLVDSVLDATIYAKASGFEPASDQLRADAEKYLGQVAERLKGSGCKVQSQAVHGQHPASAILDVSQKLAADLIVLETHGRRGLSRLLLGSVADKVLRGSAVPVLVHRGSGK